MTCLILLYGNTCGYKTLLNCFITSCKFYVDSSGFSIEEILLSVNRLFNSSFPAGAFHCTSCPFNDLVGMHGKMLSRCAKWERAYVVPGIMWTVLNLLTWTMILAVSFSLKQMMKAFVPNLCIFHDWTINFVRCLVNIS